MIVRDINNLPIVITFSKPERFIVVRDSQFDKKLSLTDVTFLRGDVSSEVSPVQSLRKLFDILVIFPSGCKSMHFSPETANIK